MENKNIIIILLAIIVVLAVVAGAMFLQQNKESTSIEINQTNLTVDDNIFSVNVIDSKGNTLPDFVINLSIENEDGDIISEEEVSLGPDDNTFDFDLEKGKYIVKASFNGNDNYSASNTTYDLTIKKVTPTMTEEELIALEYPKYNSDLGYYRSTGISQEELGVVELASGNYIVIAGDGYYEYGGQDNQGNIILGSFLGHGGTKIY